MANKIDSNITGLRYAEEVSPKVLPGSPVWYPLEPNSYKDFGGQLATMARKPINPSRQLKKGTVTDLDASGGFQQDLTQTGLTRLLQGIMFADAREKATTQGFNAAAIPITSVSATQFLAASGLTIFKAGDLILASGFGVASNNGLKAVSAAIATAVTASGTSTEASPPAAAKIEAVGFALGSGEFDITIVGGLPRLNRASGTVDLTTLGLIAGEWIYLGGDNTSERFVNNEGFARINAIATSYLEFDKVDWTPQAETGTGLSIRIFFGTVIKNESTTNLIKRRTYQLERTVGEDANGTMSEYLLGAVANEMDLDVKQADKVLVDIGFVATDNEQRTGTQGLKSGSRPTLAISDAFNTSSDFSRIKLALVSASDAYPSALFAYATDLKLSVKNNVSPNKAVGVLGAFDTSAGTFDVSGSLTAYFADVTAVQAVRDNSDVTIDIAMAKGNAGIVFDIPLLSLGDGRLKVEQDKPITLDLSMSAAESKFNHTLLINVFAYLPTIAQ